MGLWLSVHDEPGESNPVQDRRRQKNGGGECGECAGRSRASFFRLVEVLASHQSAFEPPASVIFVTLTYGRDYDDWRTAKKHLEALRAYMTRHWGDRMTGIWVPEVQERGAPHFHFLLRWMGDDAELDEVAGADRSRWSKEKAGRDDGMLGAHWRKISGDGGSDPRHRRRYAVAIENVEGGPGIVARYLLKRLNGELAKTRQQLREHDPEAKVWTGRAWGRFRGHVLAQFYEPPVTVETCEAGVRLEAVNEVARQVFGFKLGEIYAKDVGSRWVPVKRDDPDAQLFTPQRTRWLGHLGEYLRTGERRFLYAFGESRKVAKLIDARIDVNIDAYSTPSAFRRSLLPRSRVTLSRRLYSAVEHRRPGHRSSGRRQVTAWCFVRSAASRKRSWLRACVSGATALCREAMPEKCLHVGRSLAGRRKARFLVLASSVTDDGGRKVSPHSRFCVCLACNSPLGFSTGCRAGSGFGTNAGVGLVRSARASHVMASSLGRL